MKVTLALTHKCNLSCRYCYAGHATKPDMTLMTAEKCIDFALDRLPAGKDLDLGFFGGEPLVRFDLIREITAYSYQKAARAHRSVKIGITTNGTLVTPAIIDFAADQNVSLCISLDGPEDLHDRNRTYLNGQGSFRDVIRGLEMALKRLNTVEVNAVFGPATIMDLPRCVSFFVDFGISLINLSPDITAIWSNDLRSTVQDIYNQIADFYMECYAHGREILINLLDSKMILFIKGGYADSDMCMMGDGEWAFAPSGNIYACERFIGEDVDSRFCLGNIHTGLDLSRCCAVGLKQGNHRAECLPCKLRKYCMSWCGCANHFMSGQADLPSPALCSIEQASIGAARRVFGGLVKSGNDLFSDHILGYINCGIHHFLQMQ